MGGNPLTKEEQYKDMLSKVDWNLPGMEKFNEENVRCFTKLILGGDLVTDISCTGWALWPTSNKGFYPDYFLRQIADFIEIQNKPFWDDYEKYCHEQEQLNIENNIEENQ